MKRKGLLFCIFAVAFSLSGYGQIINTISGTGTAGFSGDGGPATAASLHYPYSVTGDATGNIYIADASNNRIRKISTSGIITTIAGSSGTGFGGDGGAATSASMNGPVGVCFDGSGNMYIADQVNQRVRKINTSGIISTFAGNGTSGFSGDGGDATAAHLYLPTAVIADVSGNVYIADQYNNRVRMVNTSGIITTFAGTSAGFSGDGGAATSAQLNLPCGMAFDGSGNMYITDFSNHRIRKVNTSGIISTVAGTSTSGFSGDGGPASSAQLSSPWGICTDGTNNIYIADFNGQRVRMINTSGIISTITGTGTGAFSGDGGPATAAAINNPGGLFVSSTGVVYFCDTHNNRIRTLSSVAPSCSGNITTIAGSGTTGGFSGDGGPATAALMNVSWGITRDGAGNVYVSDFNNRRVRKIAPSGIITTFAGNGSSGFSGDGGPATAATIAPTGLATNGTDIFIADVFNQRIRKVDASGIITTYAGNGSGGHSGDGGQATAAMISSPNGVGTDYLGNVYIPDQSTSYVRKVTPAGIITTIAGSGTPGYTGDGGPATNAKLNLPNDVAADFSGNVYISEFNNNIIRKIDASGIISTYAGTGVGGYTGDGGMATAAKLLGPAGLICDPAGNLYVAVADNHSVRKIDASGIITTVAGNGINGFSGDGGYATLAELSRTGDVCYDPGGNLYIADINNNRVRKVTFSNSPPHFTGGHSQSLVLCENTTDSISSLLAVNDSDVGQTETWSLMSAPLHGTATVAYATTTTGTTMTPTGLTYAPATGFSGSDSFKVIVNDCAGAFDTTVIHVTVNPLPSVITGTRTVCLAYTITLSDTLTGGAWNSGTTSVAIIGSSTGIVTGVTAGLAIITYTLPTGCIACTTVTVIATPGPVTGIAVTCIGSTTTLYDAGGGTWSSSAPGIATIGTTTGIVTGISTGTATMTYLLIPGCTATFTVTVSPVPTPIAGITGICIGGVTAFTDGVAGGYWSSGSTGIATIGSGSGILTGISGGTTLITYAIAPGTLCSAVTMVTVNPMPGIITGTTVVCTGQVTTLSDAGGGTWSSSSSGIATVGSASGVVTGISAGTATITYTLPSGCSTTTTLSVIPSPVPISGSTHVCLGATTTLTDTATGGYWSSSDYTTANIDAGTGVVTGLLTGTVTITYTISSGCFTTLAVTVNPAPSPIVGTLSMCPGATSILTESGGGLWGSSTPSVASIGSASGIVISATTGTTTITYTLPSGCFATAVVTVNPLPSVITGPGTVCIGTTIPLADGTTGGTWSKSNTNVNVGMVTGVVTGVTAGTTAITYTLPTGCYATRTVTVNSSPGIVTGILSVCIGATTTLSDPATGGLWTSTTPTVATIGSASGVVTGMAAGTSVMTYSIGSGCIAMATVTVNALPAVIGGPTSVCAGGATITLTDGTTGGTWSAAGSSVTVGATTGVVTGLTAGTAIIAYTGASGCFRTTTITVNPLPGTITGPLALCVGATIPLTDASPGGTWTSSTTAVATIGSGTGMLTGVTTGITAITYTLPTGCKTTATETVSTTPGPITGTATVCIGSTVTLGDIIPGGTWSSSSTNAAIGSLTGIVTGISAGTTIITYSLGSGCTVTRIMTVTPAPGAISGASAMCAGATTTLIDGTTGGVWTSGSTGTATIGATSGIVSAIVAGTTTITYTIGATGCSATMSITVNPTPSAITGPATVCTGSAITESDGVAGGTWSTTGTLLTIGGSTGVVTGVTSGMAIITYSIGSCTTTRTISVNAASPITGAPGMCAGTTSTLADATPGGTWTSSTPATATIGSATGLVTAMTPGTTTITYTIPSGCNVIMTITVNLGPSAIGGTLHVCPGATTALTDAAGGGIWISGSTTIAIIGSSTGVATGVTAGTTTITYSLGTGCTVTALLTVNPLPGAITGPSSVCPATTTTLSDGTTGGTWSSGSPGVATIGSLSGMVAGVTAGTSVITYTLPTGCISTRAETVNTGPAAITGTASVCVDLTSLLSDATGGGTWTSSATSIATISTAGLVTGILAGTTTISYTLSTGCAATIVVTVNPAPAPIGGAGIVCAGATTALTDAVTGGAWSSSIPSIATIGSATGIVTGITAGTVLITYSAGAGCSVTKTVTVTALPSPITGPTTVVCVGTAITLTDATPGGIWTSSNALIASIGSGTGVVTGINTGTAVITYSIGSGCIITRGITVNPAPPSITGANHICVGGTTSLAIATTGGAWSSGSLGIATVGSMTGVVTGTGGGLVTISYTLTPGCVVTYAVTVTAVPSFTGLTTRCAWGDTLTVHDSDPTGSYSSTVATVLNLGSGYGRVTTFAPGISTVTYTLLSGCSVTESFTVNPLPGLITGSMNVCIGTTATLYNTTSGGVWTSNNPAIASAGSATGIVTGISLGTTYVTYTLPTGCKVDTPVHVNSSPAMIVGYPTMVVGTTGTYTDGTTGGIWSSSNSAIATISVSTGVVHAVSVGVVTLTYTAITGCYSTKTVSVNPATGVSLEGVDETIIADGIIVVPNPNKGAFTITGKLGNVTGEEEVCIEMTDMLGRVVYKNMVLSNDGIIGLQVMLSDKLVNGMYLLSFHSGTENRMTHVVVNR